MNASKWPPEDAGKLAGTGDGLSKRIDKLLVPIDPAPFQLTQEFNPSWHPEKVRIKRPQWLPVKDLVADAGVAELVLDPKVPALDENFGRKALPSRLTRRRKLIEVTKTKNPPRKRRRKPSTSPKNSSRGAAAPAAPPVAACSVFEAGAYGDKKKDKNDRNNEAPADDNALKPGLGKVVRRQTNNGRGYRFVAIRGVFPLREQGLALAVAMNKSYEKDVQDLVQVNDFQIERQTMVPGPDPWSGPWERLDREPTIEMFKSEIAGFAPEPVAEGVVDRTMCMPYPERIVGVWGDLATHPDIKNFVLSEEEVETQAEYERHVIEKMKEALDKKKKLLRIDMAGRASHQARTCGVSANMAGSGKSIEQEVLEEMDSNRSPDPAAINDKLKNFIRTRGSANQHLLLFRYLDFVPASDQGKTYRYRVRLVMQNPFYEKAREEVADPSIAIGKERETEYSEPTAPVFVPEDARFYVAGVDDHVGRANLPNVEFDLFQWFESTGTVVNHKIRAQLGQFIGGKVSADVLRPAEETFDNEKVPFATGQRSRSTFNGDSRSNPTCTATF